jgi:hypothetical protein
MPTHKLLVVVGLVIAVHASTLGAADKQETAASKQKLVERPHPIADIVLSMSKTGKNEQDAVDEVIRLIRAVVAPDRWSEKGGPGTIDYYPLGKTLLIQQTNDVHERVARLLAALRELPATEGKQAPRPSPKKAVKASPAKGRDTEAIKLVTFVTPEFEGGAKGQPVPVTFEIKRQRDKDGTATVKFTALVTPVFEGGAVGQPVPFTVEIKGVFAQKEILEQAKKELPRQVEAQLKTVLNLVGIMDQYGIEPKD